jgi:hypothetical protein
VPFTVTLAVPAMPTVPVVPALAALIPTFVVVMLFFSPP